jgi:hypothetical protein
MQRASCVAPDRAANHHGLRYPRDLTYEEWGGPELTVIVPTRTEHDNVMMRYGVPLSVMTPGMVRLKR